MNAAINFHENRRVDDGKVADLVTAEDTFGAVIYLWALAELGPQFVDWHPAAIRKTAEERLRRELPDANFDRLMACVVIDTTDLFWTLARSFVDVANVLSGAEFDPTVFDPADVHESAWAVVEAHLIDPPDEGQGFSKEVKTYLAVLLKAEGYTRLPDVFRMVEGFETRRVEDLVDGESDPVREAAVAGDTKKLLDLEEFLADGLRRLAGQLLALPLAPDARKRIVARLRRVFPAADAAISV